MLNFTHLRRRIILDDSLHLPLIASTILLEQIVCFSLGWRVGVWLVKQRLNAQEYFFDGDGGFPAFFFVEDGEADCARRVDVWVEEWGYKFTLWWLCWVFWSYVREVISKDG